jgi:hypothetical protein
VIVDGVKVHRKGNGAVLLAEILVVKHIVAAIVVVKFAKTSPLSPHLALDRAENSLPLDIQILVANDPNQPPVPRNIACSVSTAEKLILGKVVCLKAMEKRENDVIRGVRGEVVVVESGEDSGGKGANGSWVMFIVVGASMAMLTRG